LAKVDLALVEEGSMKKEGEAQEGYSEGFSQELEVEGHLIDSMILTKIFDRIMDLGGDFEVLEFRVGKRKHETSYARLLVKGRNKAHLSLMMEELLRLGATKPRITEVRWEEAPRDSVLPDEFYSTSNHPTWVYFKGEWIPVENLAMDKVIVIEPEKMRAYCKSIREIKKGDLVVVGHSGIKVKPPEYPREGTGIFQFMGSRASSEKPSPSIVRQIAKDMADVKRRGGKIVLVAGPAVVHAGAAEALAKIIRMGYVDALLSGNALAVHDVELALYGTSLGVSLQNGSSTLLGNRNFLSAINEIIKAGSLKDAVKQGILKKGIMYECIINGIPFALAGSIRDDGPLPDVITDVVEAQRRYRELLKGASMVLMLATMLHSIAVANLLPSTVKVVLVDINPAVATKLLDRGTAQAVTVISDVGTFLPILADELGRLKVP
jgi:lysine-ketoglutarate reductase/saccharopine dehydrogenase-like protein (TIGR00300 family)